MTINQIRKELKGLGYKIKLISNTFGYSAQFFDAQGNKCPNIFFDKEDIEKWKSLTNYKDTIKEDVFYNGVKIYGLRN